MGGDVSGVTIRRDRVVAIRAVLSSGQVQVGTGYLLDPSTVLTAEHCTRDKTHTHTVTGLQVVRATDGQTATVHNQTVCAALDVAVLDITPDDPDQWAAELDGLVFGRVNRDVPGMLTDCVAIGFPLFQRDPTARRRGTAELHGTIYQTDEADTGHLLMREPLIDLGATALDTPDGQTSSPWGGLSGAVLFHHGAAIGVIVEHHPRQGSNALRAIAFDTLIATTAPDTTAVTSRIGLGGVDDLALATGRALNRATATAKVWSPLIPVVGRWFTGRDDILARLAVQADHTDGPASVVTQAFAGMGGVGKTTVAAAYAEGQRDHVEVVWWVRAETPATMTTDLADLATELGMHRDGDLIDNARATLRWLETTDRSWLVVFDNVSDEASVADWLPTRGNGQVVITSRNRNLTRLGQVIDLDVFDEPTASRFLHDRIVERDPAAAADGDAIAAVVERLQGLPLALEQAAAWAERSPRRTYADFAAVFDDRRRTAFPDDTKPLDRDDTAETTWHISIDAATDEAIAAGRLMAVLGHLAPDPLPTAWLTDSTNDPYLDTTPDEIEDALDALYGYSLIDLTRDALTVHRVIQYAAQRAAPPEAAAAAIRLLRRQRPEDTEDHSTWPHMQLLGPHGLHAAQSTGQRDRGQAANLCSVLRGIGNYQRASGNLVAATDTLQQAVALGEGHLGSDDENTLGAKNNLANAYRDLGRLDDAISLYEAILEVRELLGLDSPDALQTRNNLAMAYRDAGRIDEAIALHEATLADRERVLHPDHPDVFQSRNNLANAYRSGRRHDEAVDLLETTVADRKRVLGPDHRDTLQSRANLAAAYRAAGRLEDAIREHGATYEDRRRALGVDHRDSLRSGYNFALALESVGRLEEAIPLHETTLTERERLLGPAHPHTLQSRYSLAMVYWKTGRGDEAVEMMDQAATTAAQKLSPDHEVARRIATGFEKMRNAMGD